MAPARAALVRWSGRGSVHRLRRGIIAVLKEERMEAEVRILGRSVAVAGPEPVAVADLFSNMPGVSWVAVGYSASGNKELLGAAKKLASAVLRPGKRFSVAAERIGNGISSDLTGSILSAMLDAGGGARVGEAGPDFRFRAALDGGHGVVGLEVREGPGGSSTGKEVAACLVSGGKHSAVVAWMALLAGFKVRMVHAKEDEETLLGVAGLYSELSHRVEPGALGLEVVEGRGAERALAKFERKGRVFAGFHVGLSRPSWAAAVEAPLFLLPEEKVALEAEALGFRPVERNAQWRRGGEGRVRTLRFAKPRASVSDVLDGLGPRPLRWS